MKNHDCNFREKITSVLQFKFVQSGTFDAVCIYVYVYVCTSHVMRVKSVNLRRMELLLSTHV